MANKKKEPVYEKPQAPIVLNERESIVLDDKKYIRHVLRYLHHISPREDLVKERAGRGRMTFDYLAGEDVMKMLNETFLRGWTKTVTSCETKVKERRDGKWQGISVVRLRFEAKMPPPLYDFCQEDIGSKRSVGKDEIEVLEYLEKSAITDALKRCVKNISIPLGLFLYYEKEEWNNDAANEPEGPPKVDLSEPEEEPRFLDKSKLKPLWGRMKILAGNTEAAKSSYLEVLAMLGHSPTTVPKSSLGQIEAMSNMTSLDDIIAFANNNK